MDYNPTQFETWRPNFELRQSFAWFAGAAGYALLGSIADVSGAADGCTLACLGLGLWKFRPAVRRFAMTLRLAGTPLPYVDFEELKRMMTDKVHARDMWLGRGFSWGPTQTQRLAELLKRDWDKTYKEALGSLYLIKYLMKKEEKGEKKKNGCSYGSSLNLIFTILHPLKSRHNYLEAQKRIADQQGYPWIHGVGDGEDDVFQPIAHTEGHTLIIGTTGSGKTRCFDLLISQAVLRGETVFIIDPKGDHDLMEKAQRACEMLGRGDKFVSFHPAFPEQSIRINLLANWSRPSEIADRISALMPASNDNDPFKSFAFGALNAVCSGLCSIYRSPTLKNLKHYLAGTGSGAVASLVINAIDAYLCRALPNGKGKKLVDDAFAKIDPRDRDQETMAAAIVAVYQAARVPDADMDDLISMYTHNREHFGKMITSLLPVLSMLTSGTLGDMLSPPDDPEEQKKHTWRDTADLIDSNHVVYVGLDSLSDPMVGSAIGSLFLSDLACVAGARYNYAGTEPAIKLRDSLQDQSAKGAKGKDAPDTHINAINPINPINPINLFVDEAAEVVNGPFLQLLNKGRGAHFKLFVATQTYADFAARMGSKEKASQLLGNLNNRISLRCVDPETQKFVASLLPKTRIMSISRSQGLSTTAAAAVSRGGSLGERLAEEEVPLFPPELLGMLPNLEYIASLSGGHIVKGRYPLILKDKSEFQA